MIKADEQVNAEIVYFTTKELRGKQDQVLKAGEKQLWEVLLELFDFRLSPTGRFQAGVYWKTHVIISHPKELVYYLRLTGNKHIGELYNAV